MISRTKAAILSLLTLAACADKPAPPKPALASAPAIVLKDPALQCMANLDQRHVDYERVPDFHSGEGCGIDEAVKVKNLDIPLNRPFLMSCPTAVSFADFESQVIAPAAKANLGAHVTVIASAGTYDCRNQRSDHPERLSEHALGRAIDITGFTLEDGSKITVLKNWWGKDAKAAFLHQVAAGACKLFQVVLTPKSNALHRDHLHLDTGAYKKCDA